MCTSTSKCTSTEQQVKKVVVNIYNGISLSLKKNNEILPFVTLWMDLEVIILTKISQPEKNKYRMISLIYGDYGT